MNDHRFASSTRGTEFGLQIVSELRNLKI